MTDLHGAAIFLSASFPTGDDPRFEPHDPAAISAAVTSVTRAVLLAGGCLVFGAHPTISPLVLLVAGELDRRGAIDIYQSAMFSGRIPPETLRLVELGLGRLRLVDADLSGEREPSLALMRRAMLADARLVAGVFVGGMRGIHDEYELFTELRPSAARLPLWAPGGAARELRPGPDPVSERLAPVLADERYPAVARAIVAAVGRSRQAGP